MTGDGADDSRWPRRNIEKLTRVRGRLKRSLTGLIVKTTHYKDNVKTKI